MARRGAMRRWSTKRRLSCFVTLLCNNNDYDDVAAGRTNGEKDVKLLREEEELLSFVIQLSATLY